MVSKSILTSLRWVPKDEVDTKALIKRLTFRSRFDPEKEVITYRIKGEWIGIPICYRSKHYTAQNSSLVDKRSLGKSVSFEIHSDCRKGQREILEEFIEQVGRGKTNFVIEAPTAVGKTFVALKCAQHIGRPMLVVCYKKDMLTDWTSEILKHTSLKKSDIGYGRMGSINWRGKTIVLCLSQTLRKGNFGKEFSRYFGIQTFDEVDTTLAPSTFSKAVIPSWSKYRIGITATPDRSDGLHRVFKAHLQEHRIVSTEGEKMKASVLMLMYGTSVGDLPNIEDMLIKRAIFFRMINKSSHRNLLVGKWTKKIYDTGRKVTVVSEHLKHLHAIREVLTKMYDIPRREISYYSGEKIVGYRKIETRKGYRLEEIREDVTERDLQIARTDSRVNLSTLRMFKAATNIPEIAGLVVAAPFSDIRQLTGRIQRVLEGKKYPIIVDIGDINYSMTKKWMARRLEQYKQLGLPVRKMRCQ